MKGCGKPWNVDNFSTVSCGILRTGPRKTVGPSDDFGYFIYSYALLSGYGLACLIKLTPSNKPELGFSGSGKPL